jgi:hypothetical protein
MSHPRLDPTRIVPAGEWPADGRNRIVTRAFTLPYSPRSTR